MASRIFTKRHPHVGASPGTLAISHQSPPPVITMLNYFQRDQRLDQQRINNLESLQPESCSGSVTWVDVQGFGDQAKLEKLAQIFQLHPLLLEDVINTPQRPKVESYGDQLLIVVRMARFEDQENISVEQLSVVLGKNHVLTFQERYGDVFDPVRARIKNPEGRIRRQGADYLAYALIDTVIDAYYPILEAIGDQLEMLEDRVIEEPHADLLGQLHKFKNRLINLRRSLWPQREAIGSLARDDHELISAGLGAYWRDTYDHCVQTTEVTEMYREMVTGLMNTYLSSIANRTNEVMKVLTMVATIFIPLTFVAGIYGMNFEHMPELHYRWAYPAIWALMATLSVVMVVFFYHKGWVGRERTRRAREEP